MSRCVLCVVMGGVCSVMGGVCSVMGGVCSVMGGVCSVMGGVRSVMGGVCSMICRRETSAIIINQFSHASPPPLPLPPSLCRYPFTWSSQ